MLEPVFAAAGGTLHSYWYPFGDADGYVPGELPDDVGTAGMAARAAPSGAFGSASTTKLLTVEEMLTARAAPTAYSTRAPGAVG